MRFSPERARRSTSLDRSLCRIRRIAAGAQRFHARHLRAFDFWIDAQGGNRALFFRLVAVHADNDLLVALDRLLIIVRGFLNFLLHVSRFDGAQHAAHGVDSRNIFLRARFDFIGELFDGVRSRHGIDGIRHAGFVGDDLLRAQREQRGLLGGQRERFVERVRVQ